MPESKLIYEEKVTPIVIKESEQKDLFKLLTHTTDLGPQLINSMGKVLGLMLDANQTLAPDRKAVYFNCEFMYTDHSLVPVPIHEKIGKTFPDIEFEKNCSRFAAEKVQRTIFSNLICSHQNRDPTNSKWGGSAHVIFKLISVSGKVIILSIIGAASGLKEWEDMSLFLGALYYLKLVKFSDQQIQNILDAADASVAGQPDFQPKSTTIKEYAKSLFSKIDTGLLFNP